ncbi:hypothetical protein HPB48_013105 [Haemaphysalis longicornis]|uniref:Uncharacterized protein n=1 Tax=Haemaphysalis longicornis TaxID=44386 RepID=A0A9J6GMR4_HAELO|nr:hypothetical protein HPB48_013105 [Haemaphysalis longicornis]
MSATGNASGNATFNASVNASVSAADKRAQQEQQELRAAPPPAAIVHAEHEGAYLIPSQDLVRLIKHASPRAAVCKRQDIMDRDEYYNLMRMTNAEQHELLRDIRVLFTGPAGWVVARRSSSVLPWTSKTGSATPATTTSTTRFLSARAPERRLWQGEEPWCTVAFKLSR